MQVPFRASAKHPPGTYVRLCGNKPKHNKGQWDSWGLSDWSNIHTANMGRVLPVVGHSDANGLLSVKAMCGNLIWVCCDWVIPATKADLAGNDRQDAKAAGDNQLAAANRRRDRNLAIAFTGTLKPSLWAPGDTVEVTDKLHHLKGTQGKLKALEGASWAIDFGSIGVGYGWLPENLKWIKS